ncbi:MAG: hypothetical protein HYR96_12095 [Deltaproteobacteria bacterium]|nr:hypothetical protein [Deltaproteobacteria bacterium]
MVFFLKRLLFKLMELGLGLKTHFTLQTRNPLFVNFRLTEAEVADVRKSLPPDFRLEKIHFLDSDPSPAHWLSYNFYEIAYPRKELAHIRKVRCEINTFVTDPSGRRGIFVFCGSPFVSPEARFSLLGTICDFAERLVMMIYGVGQMVSMTYELSPTQIAVMGSRHTFSGGPVPVAALSADFHQFNDVSFFNDGKTFDRVFVNSAFFQARFERVSGSALNGWVFKNRFLKRAPDVLAFHRGELGYSVDALNRPDHRL